MRLIAFFIATALSLLATISLGADRVALVIGNGAYRNVPELPNPANDANAIAATLEHMGFEVIKGTDLDEQGMEKALRGFVGAMAEAKVALFYYAGHGIQVGGKNYLIPVDADLKDQASLDFETIDADKIFGYMGGEGRVALAFLDACRDNPFTRSLARSIGVSRGSIDNGLAQPETVGSGLFIGFATAPNDVAADGEGANSPFTTAMLKHLPTPGLEINQMMTRVKAEVRNLTGGGQRPWSNSDLYVDVVLVPPTIALGDSVPDEKTRVDAIEVDAPGAVVPSPTQDPAMEAAWRGLGIKSDEGRVLAFIDTYPGGKFTREAKLLLQRIRQREVGPADSAPIRWASLDFTSTPADVEAFIRRTDAEAYRADAKLLLRLLQHDIHAQQLVAQLVQSFLWDRGCFEPGAVKLSAVDGKWGARSVRALELYYVHYGARVAFVPKSGTEPDLALLRALEQLEAQGMTCAYTQEMIDSMGLGSGT